MRGFVDDGKPLRRRRVAPGLKLVAIVVASIALMMIDHARDSFAPARGVLAITLAPIQAVAELPADALGYLERYFDRAGLIRRNAQLKQKLLRLQGRLEKFAALRAENARIRALLASGAALDDKVMVARILAVGPGPYRQYVELDKGASNGVFAGQAVVGAHGIMGQVVTVTPVHARALLISDPNNGVPVAINRTGLQTIVQGTGHTDRLKLPYLANNADVKAGDLLVSSGLGGRYPANYPVARITRVVHRRGEQFLDVAAKPTADLDRRRNVLLVWNNHTGEAPSRPAPAPGDKTAKPALGAHGSAGGL